MSRGRGGRGGRGGNNKSFSREQLSQLGVTGNELLPGPVTQPPPLYPLLNRRPVPLTQSHELDYLLLLRQDYIDHMQLSPAFLKIPDKTLKSPEHAIEKLIAQIPDNKEKFDWNLFPTELRPKLIAKRIKKKDIIKKDIDIQDRLSKLEELEQKGPLDTSIKKEVDDAPDEEPELEVPSDPEDEEMDDGTDYANNYFDNGEAYEDEDDNLDDGPIY